MGKLEGKVAVITAATSGMALATAKLFVKEGAYVFITGRRKDKLDEAVKLIGKNVTGVQGDASNLADLDRLYDTVKREKSKIDILFASAGQGELAKLEEVTEEHFDKTFDLNVRGTLFTVQKALPLFNDNGSIFMNGSIASIKGFPAFGVYSASKAAVRSFARTWLVELKERRIRVNILLKRFKFRQRHRTLRRRRHGPDLSHLHRCADATGRWHRKSAFRTRSLIPEISIFDPPSNDDGPSSSQANGSLVDVALHRWKQPIENMFAVQAPKPWSPEPGACLRLFGVRRFAPTGGVEANAVRRR